MRSCAAALVALAVITECFGASDRSRQRSHVRSVPIAADIKRDVNFDCPEEFGYYPHPTDCTLYYVCVFGGALLESCTGGLMYSHELQTCDWPRNVGCDVASAVGGDEIERISEREPPPPPRRTPPPPPPRAQPNPIVTSRGQPKFNRDEYEKQQQLYAEVDDLPPVEEIESDRQQRVYRGQPSTIGQVQKDRDGYSSQVSSGRNFNSNIIPASIPQNSGKIGSFSFGSQVDDRRQATVTPAPQSYSDDKKMTDSHPDELLDIETNEINDDVTRQPTLIRSKREVEQTNTNETISNNVNDTISKRSSSDDLVEFYEIAPVDNDDNADDLHSLDDTERGKRQIRYYVKNGYKNPSKNWSVLKPVKFVDSLPQSSYNPNTPSNRYHQSYNNQNNNNYYDSNRRPYSLDSNSYSAVNPFLVYQNENSQNTFKPSVPDTYNQKPAHNPLNVATQTITKSPPISSLSNQNPFSSLTGSFYNNVPQTYQNNDYYSSQNNPATQPHNQYSYKDSSLLPSTVVTGKPILMSTSPRNPNNNNNQELQSSNEDENESEEDYDSSEEEDDEHIGHSYPKPPYEFTHPSNKYANIENPFANPNFDFDEYLSKLSNGQYTTHNPKRGQPVSLKVANRPVESSTPQSSDVRSSTLNYKGMSTPRPFSVIPNGAITLTPLNILQQTNEQQYLQRPQPSGNTFLQQQEQNSNVDVYNQQQQHSNANAYNQQQQQHLNTNAYNQQQQQYLNTNANNQQQQQHLNTNSYNQQQQQHLNTNAYNQQQQQHLNTNANNQQQQQHSNANAYNQQQQQHVNTNTYSQQQQHNPNAFNQRQQQHSNQNNGLQQQSVGTSLEAVRPKLKPPNFKDDRQLPISYSFSKSIEITTKPNNYQNFKGENSQPLYSTAKPYLFLTATGTPIILSSPKAHYVVKNEKLISQQPYQVSTGKPYSMSSLNPQNSYITFKQSTPNPLTTLANEQLSALQHYWKSTTESISSQSVTLRPSTSPDVEKLKKLFAQAVKTSMQTPTNDQNSIKYTPPTSTRAPKRRLIPKPSPEMNDYYYDDDDYYEPPVKSQYMPSTEIKPQRPHMAQNYKHYDDSYEDTEEEEVINISPRRPTKLTHKPEPATKNHNDVSVITKSPLKDYNKYPNVKIPVPVLVDFVTPTPTVIIHPHLRNLELVHGSIQNRTLHMRRPPHENGPNTIRPPKYLNQTTLRPYTVRHRLAKPTPVQDHTTQKDMKDNRGRGKHPNIVAQMLTTPHDSHNQETRITKAKYDGRTNSLEPTESVAPLSYSPSPRPKMLYNGSQNYSPDQYDPFYAIYDEDGELYKDTDYVQQYNVASVRPAVQQTYRGTPPPARRPVDSYSPRPVPVSPNDYDDDLIQRQINNHNQNQYQSPVRQSTRGEGNELGYEHIPSSVKTTIYETTPMSTTPTTTSTSTTTQRPTTARFTEAMTPSRYTPRSSTDENPIPNSESPSIRNSSEESVSSYPSTPLPFINFSSLAKPFEKTDNLHSLEETVPTAQRIPSPRRYHVTNTNNEKSVEKVNSESNKDKKKIVSLTTGFSIRRNSNNTDNPYTLTVLTRPFDDFDKNHKNGESNTKTEDNPSRYFYENSSESSDKPVESAVFDNSRYDKSTESTGRRKYSRYEVGDDYDIPIYIQPKSRSSSKTAKVKSTTLPSSTSTTKYYLKSVVKRPAPFSTDNKNNGESTENAVNKVQTLIETGLHNVRSKTETPSTTNRIVEITPKREQSISSQYTLNEPTISPYKTLGNLRNINKQERLVQDSTTSTASTTRFTTTEKNNIYFKSRDRSPHLKPSYYSYRIEDDVVPDQTTEVFSSSVKNVIQAFFNNIVSTPIPQSLSNTYKSITSSTPKQEQKVVNIGYQKKPLIYTNDDKPTRHNVQHLKIITEPTPTSFITPSAESDAFIQREEVHNLDLLSTTTTMTPINNKPRDIFTSSPTTPILRTSTFSEQNLSNIDYQSKFVNFMSTTPKITFETTSQLVEPSRKFQNIITINPTSANNDDEIDNVDSPIIKNVESTKASEIEWNKALSEIASTTSTTKSTTTLTVKIDPTTKSTTKSVSYPTRASRVNPAIKLAASNPASGRRSYQSSSKCSSDNSLQANPKCNEIKYQRPTTSTRGRGAAHYSKSGSESAQPAPNRGTPPTRSRPTLKPSTAIVSENVKFTDIYERPPSRPAPVYPQPTPDKTAAKCRKDVCLLPDCYCGGKDIPGDLPVEQVPQIVLLTFDDSVNDLNKGLYADLFEKGRVNPNGCPITSTFYVSHEWTDYSQVQNLYSAGHEMASHTISHSFGEQFSQKKWNREVGGQREILAAYGGVKLEDVRGMRAPFLSIGGNKMFKMLYDSNFTYDSSMPVYENRPPSWPYTLDYKLFHDCMIPPCPTKSYPGVWEVPMVMWQDLNGGRCSMGDACANPPEPENVYKMLLKNFDRHYTTNRAPFGLFYHAAWFTQAHHKEGFIMFLDFINQMQDVWIITNWQALQWVRDPTPISRINNFQPFQCNYPDRPKKCNNPKVCNLWHKSGVRYMRTCQPCPEVYPWTGKSGIRSSRIDNDNGE